MSGASMLGKTAGELELLRRHILMLKVARAHQPIGIVRLSEITGLPKHKVRYSLRLLENEGLIKATSDGAVVSDRYDEFIASLPAHLDAVSEAIEAVRREISGDATI